MRRRVLVAGHAGTPTGYARVLREVLPRLTPDLDVTLFALNTRDAAATSLPGVRVVVNGLLGDPYGREQLPRLVDETQPDVVLLHHDLPLYSVFHEGLAEYRAARPHVRVIAYCPIEWEGTSEGNVRTLAGVDAAVTYTEFGARAVERAFAGRADAPRVAVIGHGIDTLTFRPVAGARRALWPDRPELEDAFVVLNANRNVPRKKIDLTMSAFAEFAAGKPDAYLYLHMGMLDNGIDVPAHARELGITDRLLVTTDDQAPPQIGDEELNLVYNACDVGLNTATGEGWGLVAFEHGATGAAQVMPDHSACAELWRDRALLVPVEPGREEDGLVSRDGVVAALERLYADAGLRARLGEAAREHALDPSFDWDTIAQSWRALLLDGPPRRDAMKQTPRTPLRERRPPLPDRLELSQFQPYVGHAFGVETAAGPLELTLSEASAGPWQPEGETAFAFELIFTGPREPVLPQAIYRMTHPDAGDLDIFIVPLQTAEDGTTYQAVFS